MSIVMNKNILDWYKHYINQIDEMYNIYVNHLKNMDKSCCRYDDDNLYKNFVIYLYNNSSHILYYNEVEEDDDAYIKK